MKLKSKFIFLSGIPLIGILIIFLIGLFGFNSLRDGIENLMTLQDERAMILNADRDAYQVLVSEQEAINSHDKEELKQLSATNKENLDQTWERITTPREHFTPEMEKVYSTFSSE
jgi:methyl-accepting chemotaxis protein